MINPTKGICIDCKAHAIEMGVIPPERWLAKKKPPLCDYHNKKRKSGNKSKPLKKSSLKLVRKATGEREVFREMWENGNPRVSYVTGKPLPDQIDARAFYFSHILKKGSYGRFRLNPDNIVYMTLKEHETWEHHQYKIKDDPQWKHVFELKELLIKQYKQL